MRTRMIWAATLAMAAPAMLRAQLNDRVLAQFPDGTRVEIHSESTGATQPSPHGVIGIGPGVGKQDLVNRVVVDSGNNELFAYNFEASRGASPDTVVIRIEPLSAATEKGMLGRTGAAPGTHIPTVAAVREFSSVKIGEAVTLDILYNPSTGEKIYDVLRPILGPPGPMMVTSRKSRQEISLKEITVRVNGQAVQAPSSWMIGAAMRIDIPGHGAYVVAAFAPSNVPPIYAFKAVARADGKTLSWAMDGDYVQIDSSSNALTQAANAVLWVYHDAKYQSQDQPNAVRLQTADTVEWLIPKK